MSENDGHNAYLLLEDGNSFPGQSFGAHVPVDGEVGEFPNSQGKFKNGMTRGSLRCRLQLFVNFFYL